MDEFLPRDVFYFARTQKPLGDAVFVVRRDHSLAQWCEGCAELWGYSDAQALALTVEDLMPESFRARHYSLFERYWEDEEVAQRMAAGNEIRGQAANGETFPLEVYLFRFPRHVVVVAKVVEILLQQRVEALTLLLDNAEHLGRRGKRWAKGMAALMAVITPAAIGFAPVIRGLKCEPVERNGSTRLRPAALLQHMSERGDREGDGNIRRDDGAARAE